MSPAVRQALSSGNLAHMVTLNPDGTPQVTVVWVGVHGDEIVSGHLGANKKIRNVQSSPTVVISVETGGENEMGLAQYLVVSGHARVTEGGARELLQELARVYLGPDAVFPPMENPPPGYVIRITPDKISGVGPWTE